LIRASLGHILLLCNIQAAKGVDGVTSTERIANVIKEFSNADILCLQEVMRTEDEDQVTELSAFFPEHMPIFGAAIDRLDSPGRLQFGNMILSRLPVSQVVLHKLPQPAEPKSKHMPRQAIEIIVQYNDLPLRVTTTHLDFFAQNQRSAQIKYLTEHFQECCDRALQPSPPGGAKQFASLPETARSIYCGDFNLIVDSDDYQVVTSEAATSPLVDCWRLIHKAQEHHPTCGIFDHVQWQEGAHCRDFFFVSQAIAQLVTGMSVEVQTAASDHQPLKITLI